MKILKNFEALFVVTLGLACAANYVLDDAATAASPATQPAAVAMAAAPAAAREVLPEVAPEVAPEGAPAAIVVLSHHRLTAEQKAKSLADEQKAQLASRSNAAAAI